MLGCSALCLDEHRFASSSGCPGKLLLEGWGCLSQWGHMLKTSVMAWEIWHCWLPTPSPLSPPPPGQSSHPGAKGVVEQRLALLFVLLLLRERPDMGMCGFRAPQEQDFVPNPSRNIREGGLSTFVSCGGHWGRNPASPLLCEGMSPMSVCPLPSHKSLPRLFGGGRGPSCG